MDAVVYCRICGIKIKKSVKIFSCRGRGMGLEQKILKCLMLSVKRCDQLPTRVCFPCIDRLDDFSQFLLHVKQAQVKLRAMLKSQGVHIKDERNIELISTWKALLAHQERESVNFERGKKRKRKLEEKVYDSSDSYSPDSVSDEFSSTSDEPSHDSATGSHPLKKIALVNSEKHSLDLPLKSETTDGICKPPVKAAQEILNSQNAPSFCNTGTTTTCNDMLMVSSVPSSDPHSVGSQMQEGEITTSQDSATDVQGSSNSIYQPTTSSGGLNVTISPPIVFPAQVSNSMIVVPGTDLKSPSNAIVPFYILNVPKGGSSSDIARQSFTQIASKKRSSKVAFTGKQKIANEVHNNYALTKPFILPKLAFSSAPSSETIVLLDPDDTNSLLSSKPSCITQRSIMSSEDEPGLSSLQSDSSMNQGSMLQKSSQCGTSEMTNVLAVNSSQTQSSRGNVLSSQKSNDYSEQSSYNTNESLSCESAPRIANNESSEVVKEPSKVNESQHFLKNVREKVCHIISFNKPQLISVDSKLQMPLPSHETHGISLDKSQSFSSNSLKPEVPSCSGIVATGDKSENLRESQEPLLVKSSPKIPVIFSIKHPLLSRKKAHPSPNTEPVSTEEPKRQSGDENTATGEDGKTTGYSGERKETNHPSESSVMQVKEATTQSNQTSLSSRTSIPTPPAAVKPIPNPSKGPTSESLTFTTSSDATASTVGIQSTNATCLSSSSKSPMASWKGKQMDNLCDIPPLIPITDSLLKQYSNVECQVLPSNVPRSNFSARSEHDIESEPLIIDGLGHTEVHNSDTCTAVDGASAAKKSRKRKSIRSDSSEKGFPSCKSAKWTSGTSFVSDFTVNPDYSVVKCCLCSANSYPFLITLASASDHCKFIHSDGIGSFGCIKCDFTTDQQQQITGQLQSLQHHVSSGCKSSDASGEEKSPQKKPDDGSGVVVVKQEPVDEYEKALLNLKNSLRTVNMPRFRKLIISCGATLGANTNTLKSKDARCDRDSKLKEASGNKLFSRQGSSYVCKLCNKKSNSKHQAKVHIARHKPDERARFLFAEQRNCDTELSSTNASILEDNASGINHSSNARSISPKKMVFDIPPIKLEKADSPQQDLVANDNDCSRNDFDSVDNPLILSDNEGVSKEADMAVNAVQKNHDIAVGQTKGGADTDVFRSSSSGAKIRFFKIEPNKFSSSDKVTHKGSTSDCFSLTPLPKNSSDSQEQSCMSHSRHNRSRPIVKPLFKAPTIIKDYTTPSPISSPSYSIIDLTRECPSNPTSDIRQCKKAVKRSLKLLDEAPSSSNESHSKEINKESTTPVASHTPHKPQVQVRDNTNVMKVIRPKLAQGPKSSITANVSYSPILESPLPQHVDTTSKSHCENVNLNGLVLKVPFIKLQRLNLLNIDPNMCVMTQSCIDGRNEEKKNEEMKPGSPKNNSKSMRSEKSCNTSSKPTSPSKPKKEPLEKPEESILGW